MSSDLVLDRVLTAARSSIGLTTTAVVGAVRPLDLDRFAEAVAGSTGADVTGAANALYLSAVLAWGGGPPERDLLPDGNAPDAVFGVDVSGLRVMAGGQDLVFHREARRGVPVTIQTALVDAELKEGNHGRFLVLTVERRYLDDHGLFTECRERFLARGEVG